MIESISSSAQHSRNRVEVGYNWRTLGVLHRTGLSVVDKSSNLSSVSDLQGKALKGQQVSRSALARLNDAGGYLGLIEQFCAAIRLPDRPVPLECIGSLILRLLGDSTVFSTTEGFRWSIEMDGNGS